MPPLRRSICAFAWEGVLTAGFGFWHDPLQETRNNSDGNWQPSGGYEYTDSSAMWLKCARSECLWCGFLAKHFPRMARECEDSPLLTVRIGRKPQSTPMSDQPMGEYDDLTIVLNKDAMTFRLYTSADDPAAAWIKGRTRIPHVNDTQVLALAKTCVEECARDHEHCQAVTRHPSGFTPLPTRLIDCSDPRCIRLIKTDPGARGTYIALSYVWGEDQPNRTTRANISAYMVRIDPSLLPQTIHDAIRVTQALGIRLLWADSLCIIQDSPEDKHRELAYMLNVYRYAYLTIDAASAACASEGFLHNQRPLNTQAMLPFIGPPDRAAPSAALREIGNVYVLPCDSVLRQTSDVETHSEILSCASQTGRRAWCLQETLMSTRILVFSSETLQLRCQSTIQNIGGALHRTSGHWDLARLPSTIFDAVQPASRGSEEWWAVHRIWENIVRDYSRRLLSHSSDKLAACAGLAEMFAHALGATYAAGLWHDTLLVNLFWQPCDDGAGRLPPASYRHDGQYRAPSWSWASFEGEVMPRVSSLPDSVLRDELTEFQAMAELVECVVAPQDENLPFGAVVHGLLTLRTRILKVQSIVGSHAHRASLAQYLVPAETAQDAGHNEPGLHHSNDTVPSTFSKPIYLWSRLDSDEDDTVQDLWIVPIWRICKANGGILGLVLGEAEPNTVRIASEGVVGRIYRRVGHWAIDPDEKRRDTYAWELEEMFKANQAVDVRIV
ncbi:hypothetical protein ONZ51_g6893 [Trametes cubensis]|uniref:Heterokaryon incompatibility domain-containing protein n=1 Tax=Trametes cubensis TaxID=1111947 RepID=A0AAD7TTQ3_9APHY|nr:hypothetical protein ONZ51_g6893 [Trametes cubensis]